MDCDGTNAFAIGVILGFILCFLCVLALGTYYEKYDE